ncbi:Kef-type K+ transporter NAD-binding component [Halorubrum coriense DSM 10284]|uniref:Kef-type K+ transporter NAD-binding component n=2 Tax=Halorubrum coriense TaxID=64713 RepID=M0EQ03_9EURY|nr:Kef-type K+ transporter NAD-binding component [Halorubrum coriense DSM 10284]
MLLIIANVTAVIATTVDTIYEPYARLFRAFEIFSVAVFTIEYAARVWSAVEADKYSGAIVGRLRFASRPLLIVDLLAIAPFYIAITGIGFDLRFLRALRLIRLFRLLKLARYSTAMRTFGWVLEDRKEKLVIAVFANGLLLVVASSVMYFIESGAQPEEFSSIPATMWWGVAALTTVGYGDMYPVTMPGQFIGAITAILGIGMFALPASILAAGFMEAAENELDERKQCPHCGEPVTVEGLDDVE